MIAEVEKLKAQLANRDAGWVTRRDAAEDLGKIAAEATNVLHAHADEPDADVKIGVERAIGWVEAGLKGTVTATQGRAYTLDELVRGLESEGRRTVTKKGDAYAVEVVLKGDRKQSVTVVAVESREGKNIVRVSTRCGRAGGEAHAWALRNNLNMIQCALALNDHDGEEEFVLLNCFLAEEVTPKELKASVKEIAFYGDWIEAKLTGGDAH